MCLLGQLFLFGIKKQKNQSKLVEQYANNIRTALDDAVKKVEDVATIANVNVNEIVELYNRVRTLEGV
jgi:adenylyl- and sulfurtransferase ThiI